LGTKINYVKDGELKSRFRQLTIWCCWFFSSTA